ncbi:MBL fold metallo-hydrolase [Rhodococcus hoagii]|nr:MBL fold metallo-hydrolase [Prescottella equi]
MEQQSISIDDDYTGDLSGSSAAQRRTVPGATITKMSVGPMDNNTYLITCSATGKSLLIDAANDAGRILQLLDAQAPELELIVTTHQHHDHWFALAEVAETRCAYRCTPARLRDPVGGSGPQPAGRRHRDRGRSHARGYPSERAHAGGITLALTENGGNGASICSRAIRCFPAVSARPRTPNGSPRSWTTSRASSSPGSPTRPSSTPRSRQGLHARAERPHLGEWRERGW